MSFTVSPGIVTREIDLTAIVPEVAGTAGGAVGSFQWGPVQEVRTIASEDQLVNTFQKPNLETYNYFFTAANFLSYGNNLNVIRVANSTAKNATTDAANAVFIANNYKYQTTYETQHGGSASNDFGTYVAKFAGVLGNSLKISKCGANKANTTLTGTVTVGAGSSNAHTVTGVGTTFTTELGVGDVIQIHSNSYMVSAVTNTTQITVKGHNGAAQGAGNTAVRRTRSAFKSSTADLIGVVTVVAGNTAVTGTNTLFTQQVNAGDIIKFFDGEEARVNSITSDTALVLATPKTNAVASNTFNRRWEYEGSFDDAPTATNFGTRKGTIQDEIHLVIVDEDGEWTGQKGQVLETFAGKSVASDAKDDDGTSQYYVDVINRQSDYVYFMKHAAAGSRDASLNTIAWGAVANSAVADKFQANSIIVTESFTGGVDGNTLSDGDLITGY